MQDDQLNELLREWANDQLPDAKKRDAILGSVFDLPRVAVDGHSRNKPPYRSVWATVLAGTALVAMFIVFFPSIRSEKSQGPVDVSADMASMQNEGHNAKLPISITNIEDREWSSKSSASNGSGVVQGTKAPVEPQSHLVSILVLCRVPGSDSNVEFLEDTVLATTEQNLYEIKLNGHRMFLWIYPLEKTLFSLDVGIDKVAETGIVAVPDKTKAVYLMADGRQFDVFVSIL